jgi:Domain of unknown function (DUF222)
LPEDDFDLGQYFDWVAGEIEAGRLQVPREPAVEDPAVSLSLGDAYAVDNAYAVDVVDDAYDVDSVLPAAMRGPQGRGEPGLSGPGLGGQGLGGPRGLDGPQAPGEAQCLDEAQCLGGAAGGGAFGRGQAADLLPPGPDLAALTAQALSSPAALSDDELLGALQAARRLKNLAGYQQTLAIAEFARRRQAQFQAARAAGKPAGCRDGEFPGEELAMELMETGPCTGARIDTALELTARLPRTLTAMADGSVDLDRAITIAARTAALTDTGAAYADEVLASAAPGLRPDQLARKAAALEMKLAPDAVRARKELARRLDQRVEARREASGNSSLAGRELPTADVIAAKAHLDAVAARLRASGLIDATLDQLRALALTDLTQGRDPLDRIKPALRPATGQPAPGASPAPGTDGRPERDPDQTEDPRPSHGHSDHPRQPGVDPGRGPGRPSGPGPVPALINLLVPADTLLGWGTAPAQAAGWGLLDTDETRALVAAAAQHPRTRWCLTVTAPDGTAVAHGCASGRHQWPPDGPAPPQRSPDQRKPQPAQHATRLLDLLRCLNLTLEPVARDGCDHRHAEDRYVPSRKLRHLLRARNQTCTAPACNAQALYCDLDHTVPYPDGPTDQCNLNPKCRRHHRIKQAPGWTAVQPAPDTSTWTTPSGRTHTVTATTYDL